MNNFCSLLLAVASAAALWACSGGADYTPVPLPKAFPRIEVYGEAYSPVEISGLELPLNSNATVSRPGDTWLDAAYPAYRGTLHITVGDHGSSGDINRAIGNRRERVALNLGDNPCQTENFTSENGEFVCELVVSPESGLTPVQFLATDGRYLVSGTFALSSPTASADSVAPVVNAVARDIRHTLRHIKYNK